MTKPRLFFLGLLLPFAIACGGEPKPQPAPVAPVDSLPIILPDGPPPVVTPEELQRAAEEAFSRSVLAPTAWKTYAADGSACLVQAAEQPAMIRLEYAYGTGTWLGAWCEVPMDLTPYKGLRLRYSRSGDRNSLEFKIEDADGSSFGMRIPPRSDDAVSTTIAIPFASLAHWWGGDQVLDLTKCKFHVAQSRQEGEPGGRGSMILESIELMRAP